MAKEAYYFSHDFGARNDPKLQKVLMKLGQEGKGVYWDLVEMLFEEGGKLQIEEMESYAFALRTTNECIKSLINNFGLFCKDKDFFWSNSVNRRLNEREQKSEKARLSATVRWNNTNALKSDATALRSESDGNAIKERKGKERIVFSVPLESDIKDYFKELGAPQMMQKYLNHYTANGWMVGKNKMKDWKAAARNSLTWSSNNSNGYKQPIDQSNNANLFEV